MIEYTDQLHKTQTNQLHVYGNMYNIMMVVYSTSDIGNDNLLATYYKLLD